MFSGERRAIICTGFSLWVPLHKSAFTLHTLLWDLPSPSSWALQSEHLFARSLTEGKLKKVLNIIKAHFLSFAEMLTRYPDFYLQKKKSVSSYCVNFPLLISHLRSQIIIAYNWKASSHCLTPSLIIHPCAKNVNVAQQSSIYTSFAEHKLYSPGYCTLGFPPHNLKLNIINTITDCTTLPFQTTFAWCRCYSVL